ncbi:hypothetical protein [Ruegeria atlantica]|uniref:hypothetical protein n=1 Tax=Ruegeria atlantica TaxID=81569 RepID=UPI00147FA1B0|nr:hypothetical protein [Ruegeria atlantica]
MSLLALQTRVRKTATQVLLETWLTRFRQHLVSEEPHPQSVEKMRQKATAAGEMQDRERFPASKYRVEKKAIDKASDEAENTNQF